MADDRARRLAAIEARLNPPTDDAEGTATVTSAPNSGSSSPTKQQQQPLFAPRALPKAWTRPSERDELEKKRELARVLNRTIIRDSGYAAAEGCVETLLKIADNIRDSGDDKFRTLKSTNGVLQKKVFGVPGGRDYLILMGFHTETRDFVLYFVIDQSQRRMYELEIASAVLREALPDLKSRVTTVNVSKSAHKAVEAARVAAAKQQIEDDREVVRQRAERERIGREARALAAKQAEATPETTTATNQQGEDDDDGDSDSDDEGEPSVDGYTIDRRWGHGRKLND